MSDLSISVESVSKKYCRSLKRSLWYGVKDLAGEVLLQRARQDRLRRDEFWALKDVSFEVQPGEMLGIIGHNGAGKSTLLKLISGAVRPDVGRICIAGRVGALIELGMGFNPILTGRENTYINAAVLGMHRRDIQRRLADIIDFAEIGEFIDTPVQHYSSGMKARLGFAVAAHLDPDVLLVDEVLSVGDTSFRERCISRLMAYKRNGGTIIFVSHSSVTVESICDRVMLLDHGRVVDIGDPTDVVGKYEAKAVELSRQAELRFSRDLEARADDIRVVDVQFCDEAGNPRDEFEFGESIEVRVKYEAQGEVQSPFFMLAMHKGARSSPVLSDMCMLWDGVDLKTIPKQGVIGCVIKTPPISPGVYFFDLCVLSKVASAGLGRKKYMEWASIGSVTVTPGSLKHRLPGAPMANLLSHMGPLVLEHSWHLDGEVPEGPPAPDPGLNGTAKAAIALSADPRQP